MRVVRVKDKKKRDEHESDKDVCNMSHCEGVPRWLS